MPAKIPPQDPDACPHAHAAFLTGFRLAAIIGVAVLVAAAVLSLRYLRDFPTKPSTREVALR